MRLNEHERPTRAHFRVLAFAGLAWLYGFYSLMLLTFVLQAVQDAFALPPSRLALLTGVGVGTTGVGGILFGWGSDRFGRRPSTTVSLLLVGLGNAACGWAPDSTALLLARALAGLGIGGTWGAGQAMIGETFPARLRGRYGAIAQSGAPLGLGLAAAIGSFLSPTFGWRAVFLASAAPAFLLLAARRFPESDLWTEHRRKLREKTLHPEEIARAGRPVFAQLLRTDVVGLFARAFVLTALNMSAYWFAIVWLPRYLQHERGLTILGSGAWTLVFVSGSLTGYLTYGLAADLLGRRRAFTLYSAVLSLGLAMITLFWETIASRPRSILAFLFVAGIGTGTWSTFGPVLSELFPTRVRGTALSVIMNVSRGAQFLAPIVIAEVAERFGLSGGVALASGFAALAGAWVWTLPETRGRLLAPEGT